MNDICKHGKPTMMCVICDTKEEQDKRRKKEQKRMQNLGKKLARQYIDMASKQLTQDRNEFIEYPLSPKECTTHHYACNCREEALKKELTEICYELRHRALSESGNTGGSYKLFQRINKFWKKQYGEELVK